MDTDLIAKWLNEVRGWLDPPGSEQVFTSAPDGENRCCAIGIVHEHRFAFYHWALLTQNEWTQQLYRKGRPPALVTVDYHDDIGIECDFTTSDLDALDFQDRVQLGLFCWSRLRRLNDGQVAPALYLNLFSDVYVLLKQERERRRMDPRDAERKQQDRIGNWHTIRYFDRSVDLVRALATDESYVFLDLDLDYFTRAKQPGDSLGSEVLVNRRTIRNFLSPRGRFMSAVLDRLVGMTIALEPQYCGGLAHSLYVLDILNDELFARTLCTDKCQWRCLGPKKEMGKSHGIRRRPVEHGK
jgi:hypothetical protein